MQLKKIFFSALAIFLLGFFLWKQLESPETYVKKKTLFLIKQSSFEGSGLEAIKRFNSIERLLHVDVSLVVIYKNETYDASSLNEARRLFFLYFSEKKTNPKIAHTEIKVLKKEETRIDLQFQIILKRNPMNFACKTKLQWEKREKRWRLKQIRLTSCKDTKDDTF